MGKKIGFVLGAALSIISPLFYESASAQKWADLSITIVLDGEIPAGKPIAIPAGNTCVLAGRLSDDLIIDPKSKGIANVVFMIDGKKTELQNHELHPDFQKVPDSEPLLDNINCMFEPHVLAVRAGQTIEVKNSDKEGHNANFSFFANRAFNPVIPVGKSVRIPTAVGEKAATKVECNIHPWMNSYIFVLDHPYIGISDANGKIKIEKLPAETELNFKIWHETQNKAIEQINLDGKAVTWSKGTVKLTLKEGLNDLGTILLKPDRFKK